MAFKDMLLRARRKASLAPFNAALPANFKIIVKIDGVWVPRDGVNLDPIASLEMAPGDPPTLSSDVHYNLRVTDAWSGWVGLIIPDADPDSTDDRLNKCKVKQWFKNNGVERTDTAGEHSRSSRSDMRWFRWTDDTDWVDVTIDEPAFRRRVWL